MLLFRMQLAQLSCMSNLEGAVQLLTLQYVSYLDVWLFDHVAGVPSHHH